LAGVWASCAGTKANACHEIYRHLVDKYLAELPVIRDFTNDDTVDTLLKSSFVWVSRQDEALISHLTHSATI